MMESIIKVKNLHSSVEGKGILKGIDLEINPGEIHVIMGPNGAGKSTLANVLMGHPKYTVTDGQVTFLGEDLLEMSVDERARKGLFLSFQYPEEVPGVKLENFLRTATKEITGKSPSVFKFNVDVQNKMSQLQMNQTHKERYLNQGLSGGEKKKSEMLQMSMLNPKLAILDETDSGLDIDALKVVYENVQSFSSNDNAILIITHYNKILEYIEPDCVHILVDGKIVKSGDVNLAHELEKTGYDLYKDNIKGQ